MLARRLRRCTKIKPHWVNVLSLLGCATFLAPCLDTSMLRRLYRYATRKPIAPWCSCDLGTQILSNEITTAVYHSQLVDPFLLHSSVVIWHCKTWSNCAHWVWWSNLFKSCNDRRCVSYLVTPVLNSRTYSALKYWYVFLYFKRKCPEYEYFAPNLLIITSMS